MIKLERHSNQIVENYYKLDFYREQYQKHKSPFSLIMDLSDFKPAEIEIEDDIKEYSLWNKFSHYFK